MARIWSFGSDVDTDQIVPGRYAPYMTRDEELGRYAFIEARPDFAAAVRPGDLIVAGPNFGCGSSREYAAQALHLTGLAGIFAPSFARIFYRNAANLGLRLFEADLREELGDGEEVDFDFEGRVIRAGGRELAIEEPPELLLRAWQAGGLAALLFAEARR
ncbi:MAG: homoaconitate hydratase [Planctomycetes bacterium]|nr:homoaconitate hydratase [Planctomycetota bacterium]